LAMRTAVPMAKRAIAFEGGGWKANTVHMGLTSGLLAVYNREHGDAGTKVATMESSGVFSNFKTYSSNSGGSWFTSSLVYSPSFKELLENMGAEPNRAGTLYNKIYTESLLEHPNASNATNVKTQALCEDTRNFLMKLLRLKLGANATAEVQDAADAANASGVPVGELLGQVLDLASMGEGFTWPAFVQHLLNSTANISNTTTLGSKVNSFAKGKDWVIASSGVTPGGDSVWANDTQGWAYITSPGVDPGKYLAYQAASPSGAFPTYIPTRFSVTLGATGTSPAPLPVCGQEDCFGLNFKYTIRASSLAKKKTSSAPKLSDVFQNSFALNPGALPLTQVVSSSSSFVGGVITNGMYLLAYTSCIDVTTFVTGAPNGQGFSIAQDDIIPNIDDCFANATKFQEVVQGSTTAIVDGGYTDNTGVSNAVSAGATEVVSFLQWYDIQNLFQDDQSFGTDGTSMVAVQVWFRVFAEPAAEVLQQSNGYDSMTGKAFKALQIPSTTSGLLLNFTFGTIKATTVDCPWFGIKAGIPVTIQAFFPTISLGIGGTDSWYLYGDALNDITSTMVYEKNRDLTKEMLHLVMG